MMIFGRGKKLQAETIDGAFSLLGFEGGEKKGKRVCGEL